MTQQEHFDRRFDVLPWISIVITVLVIVVTILLIPVATTTRNNATQVEKGNQLAACRSMIWADVAVADAQASALIIDALGALQRGDDERFTELVYESAPQISDELRRTQIAYEEAVDLSVEDPDEFLRQCHEAN